MDGQGGSAAGPVAGKGEPAARSVALPKGVLAGVGLLFEGLRVLLRERSLWGLASVPVSFSVLAILGVSLSVYEYAAPLHDLVTVWMPSLEVGAWYTWLWLGPLKLVFGLLGVLLFGVLAGLAMLVGLLLANMLSAPFLDALSQRTERIESGDLVASGEGGWGAIFSDARRTMANEIQRLLFFVGVWLAIALAGALIPGGQVVAPFLLLAFAAVFLPLDYAGYSLDRRQVSFAKRRLWVRNNLPTMLGFGGSALCTTLIPGLNLLLLPTLVVGGTLLALRCPVQTDPLG